MTDGSTAHPAFLELPDPNRGQRVGPPPCRWTDILLERQWTGCRNPASLKQGNLLLCDMHARAVAKMTGYLKPEDAEDRVRDRRRHSLEHLRDENTRLRAQIERLQAKPKRPVITDGFVYFLRTGGLIKIGWTSNLNDRMRKYHPDDRLLAVMPGTRKDERRIHRRFAHLLTHGREWFPLAPQITEYIDQVVADHGEPPTVEFAAKRKTRIVGPRLDRYVGTRGRTLGT